MKRLESLIQDSNISSSAANMWLDDDDDDIKLGDNVQGLSSNEKSGESSKAKTDRDELLIFNQMEALNSLYRATSGQQWRTSKNWGTNAGLCSVHEKRRLLSEWHGVEVDENGNVSELRLLMNELRGHIPVDFCNLPKLRYLDISNNKIIGVIPEAISRLEKLAVLKLHHNNMSGEIPQSLCQLKLLKGLHLEGNNFQGQIPKNIGDLKSLIKVNLSHSQLTGRIPSSMGNLKALQELKINNNRLTGEIPPELANLTDLRVVNLSQNQLVGPVHTFFCDFKQLSKLYLQNNNLSGQLSNKFMTLTSLDLRLEGNKLSGPITVKGLQSRRSLLYRVILINVIIVVLTVLNWMFMQTIYFAKVTGLCLADHLQIVDHGIPRNSGIFNSNSNGNQAKSKFTYKKWNQGKARPNPLDSHSQSPWKADYSILAAGNVIVEDTDSQRSLIIPAACKYFVFDRFVLFPNFNKQNTVEEVISFVYDNAFSQWKSELDSLISTVDVVSQSPEEPLSAASNNGISEVSDPSETPQTPSTTTATASSTIQSPTTDDVKGRFTELKRRLNRASGVHHMSLRNQNLGNDLLTKLSEMVQFSIVHDLGIFRHVNYIAFAGNNNITVETKSRILSMFALQLIHDDTTNSTLYARKRVQTILEHGIDPEIESNVIRAHQVRLEFGISTVDDLLILENNVLKTMLISEQVINNNRNGLIFAFEEALNLLSKFGKLLGIYGEVSEVVTVAGSPFNTGIVVPYWEMIKIQAMETLYPVIRRVVLSIFVDPWKWKLFGYFHNYEGKRQLRQVLESTCPMLGDNEIQLLASIGITQMKDLVWVSPQDLAQVTSNIVSMKKLRFCLCSIMQMEVVSDMYDEVANFEYGNGGGSGASGDGRVCSSFHEGKKAWDKVCSSSSISTWTVSSEDS